MEDLDNKFAILCFAGEKINALEDLTNEEQQTLYIMQQAKLFSDKDLTITELMKNMELKRGRMQTILDNLEKKGFISVHKVGKVYQYVLLNEFLE